MHAVFGKALPLAELAQPWQALQQNWATREELALKTKRNLHDKLALCTPLLKAALQVPGAESVAALQVNVLYELRPSSLSRCLRHASLM